ncbi:hypothetical protein HPK01_14740, partial [Anoxybacillus flavithermus]|nr:hypothetical protein [Anoxybacillus flavithermus]
MINTVIHRECYETTENPLLPVKDEGTFRREQCLSLFVKDNEETLEYKVDTDKEDAFYHYPIPDGLNATLFDHQVEGFRWLCNLAEQGRGGLLADDMGLGKTIQVITFLLHQK